MFRLRNNDNVTFLCVITLYANYTYLKGLYSYIWEILEMEMSAASE